MTRDTTIIRLASSFGENLIHFVVGLAFMAGGGWLVYYALHQEPHSDKVLYIGIGVAVFGAWIMPTIATSIRQLVVIVAPYLPKVGGQRAGDPPAQP